MFQATRRRLALWYAAVTAALLLLFATSVYLYVRSTLIERVDDTLNHVVEVVERSLVLESVQTPGFRSGNRTRDRYHINLEASFHHNADTTEDDRIELEWFGPTGELLWSTLNEPLNVPIHVNRTGETVRIGDRRAGMNNSESGRVLRQVTDRVEIGRQVLGYLRVSHPWFEVAKPSRQLIVDLSLGIAAMVISVTAIGWLLSDLAMKPVRAAYLSLKQFTADASHELRNPIATIQTNVQASLADPDLESPCRQQLQVIERLTRRMGRLVDDLLFLARCDSGTVRHQWQLVPLDALLMEVIEEQNLAAREKGVTLNLRLGETGADLAFSDVDPHTDNWQANNLCFDDEAFTLPGDWNQLTRLFTNLVSNALQYTPAGGTIAVELERRASKSGSHLQVRVSDTGIGIPKATLPHLFERFYRVDPARTRETEVAGIEGSAGSGLGLAIASAIVENHQGRIQIDSQLHWGTLVTVTLPAIKADIELPPMSL